ncbi:hypothetical protein O181_066932 [Austropuccinia psidii MF-1]|uniref:PX domain-containing protein n=1 Tax=Austropuccinia psidii MF-1 TaxID=1389203 RepID=A0A9Q3I4R9_9BASI|nr:hypothetical protein [Austropuccinia psidii MF-1]
MIFKLKIKTDNIKSSSNQIISSSSISKNRNQDERLSSNHSNHPSTSNSNSNLISQSSQLNPLRAHYLKRELVTLQFIHELDQLSTPHALSLLGHPFLPTYQLNKNGSPLNSDQLKKNNSNFNLNLNSNSNQNSLPFLKFFFNKFVLSFPFLINVPTTFFSHKVQPFIYSFFSRNISDGDDRHESTKRSKIAQKVQKHLGLVMAAAIKLLDNNGLENVVRISKNLNSSPNDDDAFVVTPTLQSNQNLPIITSNSLLDPLNDFDVNVVAIRKIKIKSKMLSKSHQEFLIRTRSSKLGEIYVSRRYGDFIQLAELLRVEFPDIDIKTPPPKDRRAIDTTDQVVISPTSNNPNQTNDFPPTTPTFNQSDHPNTLPIHLNRERNRLTLRAYIHRLLTKPEISNSENLRTFLTQDPIQLTPLEKKDVESREALDRARDDEKQRFKLEVESRVRELEGYLRGFRDDLVKSDGLSRVFTTLRNVDKIEKLPIEYRKIIEWARISLASTIYQVFLGSDSASASFAQLKRTHALMPYWAMRGALKISNPVAMIRGILDLFLARPFGATSLVQRMFSSGLYEEIHELKEDCQKVANKINDDRMCTRVKIFVEAPREIQEIYEADAKNEKLDIMTIIFRSPQGPKLDGPTFKRLQRAAQAYEKYKAYRDSLEDPEMSEGPDNEDAWLYEDLHVYMKLLRRCRDKEQLIELIFEGTTSEMLKDIVTMFYSPLMQVYKAANISESLLDWQKFMDDLIRTVERAEDVAIRDPQQIVQTFVDLVGRHEEAFYNFVHQVHSKGASLFDDLMHWIELFVNFVRQGLSEPISLETLLPHPDTTDRLALMEEIDEIIEYHRKLKLAHHERMMKRLARDGPEDAYDQERDIELVNGVMKNLNLTNSIGQDIEEVVREEMAESNESSDEQASTSSSHNQSLSNDNHQSNKKKRNVQKHFKNKTRGKDEIKIPTLKIIPTLTPLFTELVQKLLEQNQAK